jgi:riboflavin synthase alpha subunit
LAQSVRAIWRRIVSKGSIAIDGISLTVAALSDDLVRVQIVPFVGPYVLIVSARRDRVM